MYHTYGMIYPVSYYMIHILWVDRIIRLPSLGSSFGCFEVDFFLEIGSAVSFCDFVSFLGVSLCVFFGESFGCGVALPELDFFAFSAFTVLVFLENTGFSSGI